MQITVMHDAAALLRAAGDCEELASNALESNPVYEPWMLLPALRAFAAQQDVRIVLLRERGVLAGLFPLQGIPRYKGLPVRSLASWRHPHCMLCVPLVHRRYAGTVLAALLEWLRGQASLLELSYIPADGPFQQALVDALNAADMAWTATDAYTRPLLCRGADADGYLRGSLEGELRRDLRRREKRLNECGRLEHVVLRSRDELPRWIDDFLRLEASGWKGRRGSALACSENNRRFAVELFTGAFERGRLMMVGLDLDGKPVARHCSLLAGDGAISFKTAYDESQRRHAPGILAEIDCIRAFHEHPQLRWMDSFTAPNNGFIAHLWRDRRTVQRVAIAADLRGELALAAAPALRLARRMVRKIARRARAARTFPSAEVPQTG